MNRLSLTILIALTLSACSVGKKYQAPDLTQQTAAEFNISQPDRFQAAEPVSDWWATLGDGQLSELVAKAMDHNHDVRIAVANLQEARALLRNQRYDRFPTVEASAAGTTQQLSEDNPQGFLPERDFETYDAGLDAFWELDLFGRVGQRIEVARTSLEAREADLRAAYVGVAAEVARAYIQVRGGQHQLDVANRNAENQQRTLDLIRELESAGRGDQLDVQRAITQLELTLATVPLLEAEIETAVNRLSVLTGDQPAALHGLLSETKRLPDVPESLAVGDPAELLKRRPDVQRAERDLAQATAQYNLNVAELYPSITFGGGIGFSSTSFGDLGSSGTSTYSFGPSIRWAAFNLGRVRAQINAADARTQAQLALFEQRVLTALEETETAMAVFSRRERNRASLAKAAGAGSEAAELARLRFNAGVDDFLDVLDAERTMLQAEAALAQSETQLVLDLINIYTALGGGWEVKTAALVAN